MSDGYIWAIWEGEQRLIFELHEDLAPIEFELHAPAGNKPSFIVWRMSDTGRVLRRAEAGLA